MVLSKNIFGCLAFISIVTLVQTKRLRNYQETIIPRIYEIVERSNEIVLRQSKSDEFNKYGLLNYLQNNANLEYRVNNILNRENKPFGSKKRWIKRFVPRRQKTSDITYDKNHGLSFRPLVRLHKTKKVDLENINTIPKLAKVQSELNNLYTSYNLNALRNSIKHEKYYTKEIGGLMQHLKEVDQFVGRSNSKRVRNKLYGILKNHHEQIAAKIELLHQDILSHVIRELKKQLRGGGAPKIEDVCTGDECLTEKPIKNKLPIQIAEGVTMPTMSEEQVSEIPSALFPHQPLWNEWTGKQTLFQDVCPPGQAKLGNLCVKTPQH